MADNLETIQIAFTKRNAKSRGRTSSEDFNDMIEELSHDLVAFNTQWNNRLVPLVSTIPDGTDDANVDALTNGLSGRHLYTDATATATYNTTYYSTTNSRPKSILEQFIEVYNQIQTVQNNLETQIAGVLPTAEQIIISDTGALYDATNVETALAEIASDVNNLVIPTVTSSAPATVGSTGTAGTIAYDSGFLYVCVATNTWKRVALTSW